MIRTTGAASLALILLAASFPLHAATDRPLKSFPPAELKETVAGADVLFVVGGDNRPTAQLAPVPRVLWTVLAETALIRPDFVLWTGDTVYGYCDTSEELDQEYEIFRSAAQPLAGTVPLFNCPGNHEIHAEQTCKAPPEKKLCGVPCSEDAFRSRFGQLYGAFDYAGAHFISLDTDWPGAPDEITGEQLDWLKRDLERNKKARAIFIVTHTEFFSSPLIDPPEGTTHPAIYNRWKLHELFRRYPVKAVFSGHEHLYWREPAAQRDGIEYFVAGGAGAPKYASPDRGGYSHYLVVRLTGGRVSYELISPGHLYLQDAPSAPGEASFWIVDSNELSQPLPLRGVETDVPASLGDCGSLAATAQARRRDEWVAVDGVAIDSCAPGAAGKLRLHVKVPPLPQGSYLVTVRRKT